MVSSELYHRSATALASATCRVRVGTGWRLTRLVGPGCAAEIAYTARIVAAAEAERIGLVNKVVPVGSLLEEGVRMSKGAVQRNQETGR
jgi:enoyl-CoA hydratase/carnithine racemase